MKIKKDTLRLFQSILKSVMPPLLPKKTAPCQNYSQEDYLRYTSFKMDKIEQRAFEIHSDECPSCQEALSGIYAAKESVVETKESRFEERCMETVSRVLDEEIGQVPYSLAASSQADVDKKSELIGTSYGIGIDRQAKAGSLIHCGARVSSREVDKGTLIFNVEQITGVTRGEQELEISPPFQFMKMKLEELFRNNEYLAPFRVNRRNVYVEIEPSKETGFFEEGRSLALSIIVAIISAVTGKAPAQDTVFSARVEMGGKLYPPVGDVPFKLQVAKAAGMRGAVLSEDNRKDCPGEFLEDEAFSVRFLSHIGQVLHHLELAPERNASPAAELWQTHFLFTEGRQTIIRLAEQKGISVEAIQTFIEATEALCQMRIEQRPVSTALILGDPDKIASRLLPSEMNMNLKTLIAHMLEYLRAMATVVNGETTGFVFDNQGYFDSIRKTNIYPRGVYPDIHLLSGRNQRYAFISSLTESFIFVLSPGGNTVQVFCDGEMVARYVNGIWVASRLKKFEDHLTQVAHEKGYDIPSIKRMGKIALRMADQNLGALMVFFNNLQTVQGLYEDQLKRLGVTMESVSLNDMSDDELISFAREDGAVFIEGKGILHTFRAILKPAGTRKVQHEQGVGSRRFNAKVFSADAGCMTLVVSVDGAVTIYCDGEKLCVV